MSRDAKNFFKGLGFISPWLVGFGVFTFLPIALSLYYSFCDYALIQRGPARGVGGANYREIAGDPQFWLAVKNTVYYAAMAIPAALLVSLLLAIALNTVHRGKTAFRVIVFLPSLVPAAAAAVLWAWIFNSRYGLINEALKGAGALLSPLHLHLPSPNWLSDYALPSLAIMSLWSAGYTVVIFLAGLQDVPRELYEAAAIDGASAVRRLWHVTLPALSPVIFFNLIMTLIATFQVFTVPTLMIKAGLRSDTRFYSMYVFDEAFNYNHMGYASALAWVQLLIILMLTGVAFWTARRWVHYR